MKKIPLRNRAGETIAHTIVDDSDYPTVSQYRWSRHASRHGRTDWYARGWVDGKAVLLHRWLLDLTDPQVEVDHMNGNGLDNQRSNLRATDRSGNTQNRPSNRGTSSKYRGVSYHEARGKWQANVRLNGTLHYLGLHETEDQAHQAVTAWRREHMPYSTERN